MKQYAFFLGCIMPNRYPGMEAATKLVLKEFGVELLEMNGASCCPAPGVFGSFDLKTWATLAARNLCIAEELGKDITLCCNGCYATLQEANHLLKVNKELREEVNRNLAAIGKEYKGKINVKHVMEIFHDDIRLESISKSIKRPLKGIKVAAHDGCHFLKPSEIRKHGSTEQPRMLDELVEATGAESVEYKDKMMCCGAGGAVRSGYLDTSLDITREKLANMEAVNADCVLTPCAFCHLQFDRGQAEIKSKFNVEFNLPVLFYTQLLGLAMGFDADALGLRNQSVPPDKILTKLSQVKLDS